MFPHTADVLWTQAASLPEASPPEAVRSAVAENVETSTETTGHAGLIAAVKAGDGKAAHQLVESLYPTVIRIIRSHLPARTDEEDLAQDVFLKMFHKLDQFRQDSPFTHWVSRIATNTCLDALRKQKGRPEIRFADLTEAEQAVLEQASQEVFEETPDARVGQKENVSLVNKLLNKLKPDQQMVVRMLDVEQKSVKEICNLTGWTASKVKVTAMRARRHLTEIVTRIGKSLVP